MVQQHPRSKVSPQHQDTSSNVFHGTYSHRQGYQITPGTTFPATNLENQHIWQSSIEDYSPASASPQEDEPQKYKKHKGMAFGATNQARTSINWPQRLTNVSNNEISRPIRPQNNINFPEATVNPTKSHNFEDYSDNYGVLERNAVPSDRGPVADDIAYVPAPSESYEEAVAQNRTHSDISIQPTGGNDRMHQHSSSSTALATAAAAPASASFIYSPHHDFFLNAGHFIESSNGTALRNDFDTYPTSLKTSNRATLGLIDPTNVEDDDEEDTLHVPNQRRKRRKRLRSGTDSVGTGTRVTAIESSEFLSFGYGNNSSAYGQVPEEAADEIEKSDWLDHQTRGNTRLKWAVASLIVLIIVLAILGGIIGAVITSKKSSKSDSNLNIESPQIQGLLGNRNLHKVFPGIDYTPLNAQYPACLSMPPSQDNITQDLAVLSQLTPSVRLYGTDCNQTEMVIDAISALNMKQSIKIWLGVWLENNKTTNTRQLSQMYSLLDKYPTSSFAGIIVGNEVLFRKDLTESELIDTLNAVRAELKSKNIDLPIATSDLGSSWTLSLVEAVDIVMSNVHPFFGGVPASQSATWTWSYWQENDVALTHGIANKQSLIAETGWPSGGGNDCGTSNTCGSSIAGSVAGISQMNTFLNDWVCDALTNSTRYFWFEAFDEPWKVIYNTPTEQWEDKWGMMDVDRNLKAGLKIPDCGGKTASLVS